MITKLPFATRVECSDFEPSESHVVYGKIVSSITALGVYMTISRSLRPSNRHARVCVRRGKSRYDCFQLRSFRQLTHWFVSFWPHAGNVLSELLLLLGVDCKEGDTDRHCVRACFMTGTEVRWVARNTHSSKMTAVS